jgi:MFS family permease
VLVAATAAQTAVSFVNFGLPSIGPELRVELGLSLPALGAVLTAGLLGSGVSLIGAGVLLDHIGSRRALLGSAVCASTAMGGASFATSARTLFVCVFLFGVFSSVVPMAGAGELFRVYPAERRGWALGVRQMAVPLGGVVAAILLPIVTAVAGLQPALLVVAAAVLVSGVAFGLLSDDGRPDTTQRRQRDAFASILRAPGALRLLVVASVYIVVLQSLVVYGVTASRAAGLSQVEAVAVYAAVNLAAACSRVVWGRIADRASGTRRVQTLVEVGIVGSLGALLFGGALHTHAAIVFPAAVVFAIGALGWNGLLYVIAGEQTEPGLAVRSVAVATTVVFAVSALASPGLGALVDAAGWDALWVTMAVLAGAGAFIASRLPRRDPESSSS